VLVDSSQEKQLEYFPEEVVKASAKASAQLRRLERLIALGIPALNPSLVPLEGKLPLEAAEASRALLLSDPKHLVTLQGEVTALERGDTEPVKTLGDISLIVLSHGQFDAGAMGVSAEVAEQYGQAWQELQVELAALSSKGKRIVAEGSGHNIHLDQPELVISAIEEVLAEASE
jgi:pimeloyl-ACP methyl ester carboxylesterase